jgi:hypothetical protein
MGMERGVARCMGMNVGVGLCVGSWRRKMGRLVIGLGGR